MALAIWIAVFLAWLAILAMWMWLLRDVNRAKNARRQSGAPVVDRWAVLNELSAHVYDVAASKGFHDAPVPVATSLANLHGEVSELWEAYRRSSLHAPCDKAEKMRDVTGHVLTCAEEELADILIRTLDTAEEMGIDIAYAARVKSKFNESREKMHGGKIA